MRYTKEECEQKANQFLNENIKTINEAINGAKDIIAQRYADDFKSKEVLRNLIQNWGVLEVTPTKEFDKNGLYSNFANINEKIKYIKSHRVLAILRAVNEKQLSIKVEIDENHILDNIKKIQNSTNASSSKELVFDAYKDGFKKTSSSNFKKKLFQT